MITKIDKKCRGIDFTELSCLEANLQVAISSDTENNLFFITRVTSFESLKKMLHAS